MIVTSRQLQSNLVRGEEAAKEFQRSDTGMMVRCCNQHFLYL